VTFESVFVFVILAALLYVAALGLTGIVEEFLVDARVALVDGFLAFGFWLRDQGESLRQFARRLKLRL